MCIRDRKDGGQAAGGEKKEDGSTKKGKNKKKGWRYGKMSLDFDAENFDVERNETEAEDLGEDFDVGRTDRNETVDEVPAGNATKQSVPEGGLELGWTAEDRKIWIKYGLSPAYLREMRKIEERLLGCLLYTSPSPRDS